MGFKVYKGIKRDLKAFGIPLEQVNDFLIIAMACCIIPFILFGASLISFILSALIFKVLQNFFKKRGRQNLKYSVFKFRREKKIFKIKSTGIKKIERESLFTKR